MDALNGKSNVRPRVFFVEGRKPEARATRSREIWKAVSLGNETTPFHMEYTIFKCVAGKERKVEHSARLVATRCLLAPSRIRASWLASFLFFSRLSRDFLRPVLFSFNGVSRMGAIKMLANEERRGPVLFREIAAD